MKFATRKNLNLKKEEMVVLSNTELEKITGGVNLGTGASGLFSSTNIAAAGRLVTGVGYLGGAFSFGFALGTFGYGAYSRYKYNTP